MKLTIGGDLESHTLVKELIVNQDIDMLIFTIPPTNMD
jgi:hypothetical protein